MLRSTETLESVRKPTGRRVWRGREDAIGGYLMVAPTVLGLGVFALWPIVQSLYLSFTSWGAFGKYQWTGLENYQRLLGDAEAWRAFLNTLLLAVGAVPGSIVLAVVIAALLNQRIRGVGVYRLIYFLPVVTMPAASAMIWKWLYNGDYGLINQALALVGIDGPRWLTTSATVIPALVVVAIWSGIGLNMVILLAGLQGIPSSLYEAAALDGAGRVATFVSITLPLLTPTIFLLLIINTISNLQLFELVYLMLGTDNPRIAEAQTAVYLFYQTGFAEGDKGYAATIIVVLFLLIMAFTALQFRLQKKWVHYE